VEDESGWMAVGAKGDDEAGALPSAVRRGLLAGDVWVDDSADGEALLRLVWREVLAGLDWARAGTGGVAGELAFAAHTGAKGADCAGWEPLPSCGNCARLETGGAALRLLAAVSTWYCGFIPQSLIPPDPVWCCQVLQ
jgi:hypothetical protein